MKFLLVAVNAKYIHSNPALYSLRVFAGKNLQEHVEFREYTINHRQEDILGDIYRRKPDAVAFSCYIWNWSMVRELAEELGRLLPGLPIWLGGPEVSFDATEILQQSPWITGIMLGEGEETFRELLTCYVNEENKEDTWGQCLEEQFKKIPGLMLRTGFTGERPLLDLNRIPFWYEDLEPFTNRIIYYESSRGCPFRCSYCLSSIDKRVRLRDVETVKKELQFFLDRQVPQVKFVDRTFNCDHQHAMSIWKYISQHDNGVTNFHFEISGDLLREEELELLSRMRPGLVQLEIGVQSTNPETLQEIHRFTDLDRLAGNVERIRQGRNIHQHLDLIAGLPFEDYASFTESFDQVYAMRPHQLQLGFLKVLKGSPMYQMTQEYGLVYQSRPPYQVYHTRWLSYEELMGLKLVEEMVELYYNSNQFTHTLPLLEQRFSGPFALYRALADFYEARGYFVNTPARVQRYKILLEFAVYVDPERADWYREALIYDLYLREKVKSRPDFGSEPEAYKDWYRWFYDREAEHREYLPGYQGCDARQLSRMTHLEPFRYPVWMEQPGKEHTQLNEEQSAVHFVLFDYRERDPLTGAARTVVLDSSGKRI